MELLIPHECQSCGVVDEAKFIFKGPHVQQLCNRCDKHVKFFTKGHLPDVREIRLRIWSITQDIQKINRAKAEAGFIESLVGLDAKMVYWRLYLKLREMEALNA